MKSTIDEVAEFHEKFGRGNRQSPYLSDPEVNQLRIDLLQEELDELKDAIATGDAAMVLDSLTDLQYVLDGAYLELGFGPIKYVAFDEVHDTNMKKEGGGTRKDGKILKPEGWMPPRIAELIASKSCPQCASFNIIEILGGHRCGSCNYIFTKAESRRVNEVRPSNRP